SNRTLSDADQALAERVTQLQATLEGDDQTLNAAILETQRTQAEGDSALAEQLTQLAAKVVADDKVLDAAIKQTQQAQVAGDSALATRMDQLQATLEGDDQTLNAAILETQRTQAQGDQALAEQLTQLQAKVVADDKVLDAAIKQNQQAQVTGDSALATRMDKLQATLEGDDQTLNAAILETQRTQAAGDQALADQVAQLQAKVTEGDQTLNAAIQQTQQAQVAGDKANAEAITKVQANLNNTNAAVQSGATATANLRGEVEAGWYTKAKINGEGGGFGLSVKLNADGTTLTSFVVDTDVFAVMSRAAGAASKRHPFIIKNGTVFMNHAMMDTAEIGAVIAKYINVQHLKGTLIEGGSFRGGDLWLGENSNGQFGAYGKRWNAGIDSTGRFYGSDVYFSSGTFQGNMLANSGTMNNVTIRENCQVLGQLDVNQVVGDITTLIAAVANFSIPAYRRARNVVCIDPVTAYGNVSGQGTIGMAVIFYLNGVEKGRVTKTEYVATGGTRYFSIDIKPSFELPANTNATITFGLEAIGGGAGISSTGFSGQAIWLTGLK
ncbi:TPA: DUF1983 domain-containing protein, partial [Aeromonas dhakensis]|nr:DUF1983 domain-containing protein [Aeromonas dhakensis]